MQGLQDRRGVRPDELCALRTLGSMLLLRGEFEQARQIFTYLLYPNCAASAGNVNTGWRVLALLASGEYKLARHEARLQLDVLSSVETAGTDEVATDTDTERWITYYCLAEALSHCHDDVSAAQEGFAEYRKQIDLVSAQARRRDDDVSDGDLPQTPPPSNKPSSQKGSIFSNSLADSHATSSTVNRHYAPSAA